MARLSDEDGRELHVYELPLSEDVQELIGKTGPQMLSAVNTAKETFLNMNVNPEVVGAEVSKILTDLRERVVFGLMVYRKELLPLSKRTILGVEKTLRLYFQNLSFEEFKTVLPELPEHLELRKKTAGVAKNKFMFLAAHMETVRVEGDKALEDVVPKLEEALNWKTREANKSKKSARRVDRLGTGASIASVTGSLLIAKVLITTGGVMVVTPLAPFAPLVVSGGIALAGIAKDEASSSVKKLEAKKKASLATCSQISNTLKTLQDINNRAVVELAVCLQGCADFFDRIASDLGTLSPEDGGCESDAILKLIHRGLKDQAGQVIQACIMYGQYASQVETGIQVLDKFKPGRYGQQVEEWTKWANQEIEIMGSS